MRDILRRGNQIRIGAYVAVLALCGIAASAAGGSPPSDAQQPIAEGQTSVVTRMITPAQTAASISSVPAGPATRARRFLSSDGDRLLPGDTTTADLERISNVPTQTGTTVRFQQTSHGTPIMGAEAAISLDESGQVQAARSETLIGEIPAAEPLISSEQASDAATSRVRSTPAANEENSTPELVWFDPRIYEADGLQRPLLVWRVEVRNTVNPSIRRLILVDARSGGIALDLDLIAEALDRRVCDANNVNEGGSNYPCTDSSSGIVREEGDPPVGLADANDAYDFSGDTYDWYQTMFGRDSIDGEGMPLVSTVRYCEISDGVDCSSTTYPNAFWDGAQMTYGQGFASDLMVVGHELTHGVTEKTSSLLYYSQSGAINESISDILGMSVRIDEGPARDPSLRWRVGSELPAPIGPEGFRDMRDPLMFGDPNRMTSGNYVADTFNFDSGGVHINSGVGNKFFSLLVDGGTFNGQTVAGIGVDKAARIVYEANSSLLTSGSDYEDLADSLEAACSNLTGDFSITWDDCSQVSKSILAVEMRTDPPNASAPEAPAGCNTGQADYSTRFFSGFEQGDTKWNSSALTGPDTWLTQAPGDENFYARTGEGNVSGGYFGLPATSDSVLEMSSPVNIPSGASYLRFAQAFDFALTPQLRLALNGGLVEYSTDDGATWKDAGPLFTDNGYNGILKETTDNPLAGLRGFVGQSHGYISSRANLSSLAGKSVRFRFRAGTTSTDESYLGWTLDDVRIYGCTGRPELYGPLSGSSSKVVLTGRAPKSAQIQIRRMTDSQTRIVRTVSGRVLARGVRVAAPRRGANRFRAKVLGSVSDSSWSKALVYRRR